MMIRSCLSAFILHSQTLYWAFLLLQSKIRKRFCRLYLILIRSLILNRTTELHMLSLGSSEKESSLLFWLKRNLIQTVQVSFLRLWLSSICPINTWGTRSVWIQTAFRALSFLNLRQMMDYSDLRRSSKPEWLIFDHKLASSLIRSKAIRNH